MVPVNPSCVGRPPPAKDIYGASPNIDSPIVVRPTSYSYCQQTLVKEVTLCLLGPRRTIMPAFMTIGRYGALRLLK